jgi:hypothetical protein
MLTGSVNTVLLFGTSLSGYALQCRAEQSRKGFQCEICYKMNTHSARNYNVLTSAELSRKWRQKQPKRPVTRQSRGKMGEVHYIWETASDFISVCVLNGTPCINVIVEMNVGSM